LVAGSATFAGFDVADLATGLVRGGGTPTFSSMNVRGLVEAGLLGTVAGMRSTLPFLPLSLKSHRPGLVAASLAATAGELTYDKLPNAGERTAPPGLIPRLAAGAVAGALAARAFRGATFAGAAVGALTALGSTFLFHRLRREAAARVPPAAAAVGEDVLAIAASATALRHLPDSRRRFWG
jgi:uncharacterized membrane protein